jgi:hypothetical protein
MHRRGASSEAPHTFLGFSLNPPVYFFGSLALHAIDSVG